MVPGSDSTADDPEPDHLSARQCQQAVRTCLMLAMLQSEEGRRLEKLLESAHFIGRSMDLWTESLKVRMYISLHSCICQGRVVQLTS